MTPCAFGLALLRSRALVARWEELYRRPRGAANRQISGERTYTLAAPNALALWSFLDAYLEPAADSAVHAFLARRVFAQVMIGGTFPDAAQVVLTCHEGALKMLQDCLLGCARCDVLFLFPLLEIGVTNYAR